MHARMRPLAICAVAALLQGSGMGFALAQNAPAAHPAIPGAAPPSASGPGWGPEDAEAMTPSESDGSEQLPVLLVTGVEVLRSSARPGMQIVRVTGLTSSDGWSEPELVPTYAGKPADDVLDLELVATPPEQSESAGGFVPVSAIFAIDGGRPVAGVRVRGTENAVTLNQLPGTAEADVKVNDCAHCVGQQFTRAGDAPQDQQAGAPQAQQNNAQQAQQESGQQAGQTTAQQAPQTNAQPTGQNVVRAEDLPQPLRVIRDTDGIRGVVHDPNRLTLILDRNNRILDAFWE